MVKAMDKEHPQTLTEDTLGATKGHLVQSDTLSMGFLVFLWAGGAVKMSKRPERREGKNRKEEARHTQLVRAGMYTTTRTGLHSDPQREEEEPGSRRGSIQASC